MRTIILFVFCSSLRLSSATVYVANSCPNVQPIDSFEIERILGTWYQQARYDNDVEEKEHCATIVYKHEDDGYNFHHYGVRDKKPFVVKGSFISAKNGSGILYFTSSDIEGLDKTDKLPTAVLDIDYDNYAILYDCHEDVERKTHHDYFWIITKLKIYGGEIKNIIDNFLRKATFIDKSKLVWSTWSMDCENAVK